MKRFWMCLAVVVAILGISGSAQADYRGGRNYNSTHGNKFSNGYYYTGRNHSHWEHRVWDHRYQRYLYYDPYVRSYYYWYAADSRYYPVSYSPTVVVQTTPVVVPPPLPPAGNPYPR